MNINSRVIKYGVGIASLVVVVAFLIWAGFNDQESNPASIGMLGIVIFMIPLAIIIFLTVMMGPFGNNSLSPQTNTLDSKTTYVEPQKLTFKQKLVKGLRFWVMLLIFTSLIFIGLPMFIKYILPTLGGGI
jgi:Na+/melibiose symporter-like transporter